MSISIMDSSFPGVQMRLIKPMNSPKSKGNGAKNFYVEIFSMRLGSMCQFAA